MVFRLFNNAYDRPPSADQYSILAASNRDRARNHFPNTFYGIASWIRINETYLSDGEIEYILHRGI